MFAFADLGAAPFGGLHNESTGHCGSTSRPIVMSRRFHRTRATPPKLSQGCILWYWPILKNTFAWIGLEPAHAQLVAVQVGELEAGRRRVYFRLEGWLSFRARLFPRQFGDSITSLT